MNLINKYPLSSIATALVFMIICATLAVAPPVAFIVAVCWFVAVRGARRSAANTRSDELDRLERLYGWRPRQ